MNWRNFLKRIPCFTALLLIGMGASLRLSQCKETVRIDGLLIEFTGFHLTSGEYRRRLFIETGVYLIDPVHHHTDRKFDIEINGISDKWYLRSSKYDIHGNNTYDFQNVT